MKKLRRLTAAQMAMERPGQTLQATALVHEAWIRLAAIVTSREFLNAGWLDFPGTLLDGIAFGCYERGSVLLCQT